MPAKLYTFVLTIIILIYSAYLSAGLLINEVAFSASDGDWVELFFQSSVRDSINISSLYVTMYYGTNELLSQFPITLYSYNREHTPYDDRFAVIHYTECEYPDETDFTGDTNRNGVIDIYCANYSSTFWESDCLAAIDTDDSPDNGGILDMVAWSNYDGTISSTIAGYINACIANGAWDYLEKETGLINTSSFNITPYTTLNRINSADHNNLSDFTLSGISTPGTENVILKNNSDKTHLLKLSRNEFIINRNDAIPINFFTEVPCHIILSIFNARGIPVYNESQEQLFLPGWNSIIPELPAKHSGVYIGSIKAFGSDKKYLSELTFIVIVR